MRQLKSRKEISDWMTGKLRMCQGCSTATVTIQFEVLEPYPDGCNWSDDLTVNFGLDDREDVLRNLRPILAEARRLFNVSE